MESSSSACAWQALTLLCMIGWTMISSMLGLTRRIRSLTQPWVTRRVLADTPLILQLQTIHNRYLDILFSVLSYIVSISFYTGFLPFLFWSGHSRLGRQMSLLMVFSSYIGNAMKDLVSAPRPNCPPVRRVTATKEEKDYSVEYGLPSSHAVNSVCFSGYLLHYALTSGVGERDAVTVLIGYSLVFLLVVLICIGRVYLGMHSLIDVVAGIITGVVALAFWLGVQVDVDDFVTTGQNVTSFSVAIAFLLFFFYPTAELPTPSYEYQTAGTGVAFGVVVGVHRTYKLFHHEDVPRIFSPHLTLQAVLLRLLIGIPIILAVKLCSKTLAKWLLPVAYNTMGIRIRSSCYIPALSDSASSKQEPDKKKLSYLQRALSFVHHQTYDVDTGIRFLQYAGISWSVVDLVPMIFARFKL